ncbi:DUF2178 domain-containing protein [Halolamina sp. C58]|uniref:DUF2178 domain-containing protein n=1 Tax=Halolamina sp. C58 TaxID=3421640 RepID=UPI003EB69D21
MNETGNVLETRQKYRSWMNSAMGAGIALGAALLIAGGLLERDLLVVGGVAVYWLGILSYGVIRWRAPVEVRDEREARISREASELALNVLAIALILSAPTVTVLTVTGVYVVPEFYWGMVTTLALVGMVVGVANWYVERQRS